MSFPPKKSASPPEQPGPAGAAGRERKGSDPDGVPGAYAVPAVTSGYDSERDDPPPDDYHRMWRTHDRPRNAAERERKRARLQASGWQRSSPGRRLKPRDYVRGEAHTWRQPGPFCGASCAAYFCLRQRGLSVEQTIALLKTSAMCEKIAHWQKTYADSIKYYDRCMELANAYAGLLSNVHRKMDDAIVAGAVQIPAGAAVLATPGPAPSRLARKDDLVFTRVIGQYPPVHLLSGHKATLYATSVRYRDNIVVDYPAAPSTAGASTFHQALFSAYAPVRKQEVKLIPRKTTATRAERVACPFVLLHISWYNARDQQRGHGVVVDFSNPAHPGIFDPNVGWMEPEQGFCFLTQEQAVMAIWEHYTKDGVGNTRQGLQYLAPEEEVDSYMIAFQLTMQTVQTNAQVGHGLK